MLSILSTSVSSLCLLPKLCKVLYSLYAHMCVCVCVCVCIIIINCFCTALFSALKQAHCAHVASDSEDRVSDYPFYSVLLIFTEVVY